MTTPILLILLVSASTIFANPPPLPLQIDLSSTFEQDASPSPHLLAGVRLSQDVVPLHYNLQLRPIVNLPLDDPQQFTAPGEVTIRLQVVTPTNNVTLHANDMDIDFTNVQVRIVGTSISIRVLTHSTNPTMATYTLILEEELGTVLNYDVTIPFLAKVGNRLSGLYRSSYRNEAGNQVWLATTQFQKPGARLAFPCFDEPNFKSTFNISIGRPDGYHSLSNAPILETVPIPGLEGWFWDHHATTVRMSTYLIAIIVSDFIAVEAAPELSNYDVKAWGPPTLTSNATAGFAATSAAAIPDFSAGAMENWALNTYRLNYLLFIDGETTQNEKWGIARVFAHEISHHWFGDLVTCDWWNDLWLNEGFASYMELLAENATGFDVEAMDRYPLDKFQVAMAYDVGPNTGPVHHNDTTIVNSQPSTIIYQKAASLIRMMQGFLSEETFIAGIRNYLRTHAYSNTVQDNLFAELQNQAELDGTLVDYTVKQIMDTWTIETGFPIVQVTWFPDSILFRHEKFSLNPPPWDPTATQEAGVWYTPIAYTQGSSPDFSSASWVPKFWFEPGTQNQTKILDVATDEWIVVNPDARSYFRTIYCSHFIALLITQLGVDHTVISSNTRGQLIDDYFKVFPTKGWENAQIENALDLTRYLDKEDNTAVWIAVFNNLRPINQYLVDAPFYDTFKTYLLSKITPVLDRLGWEQNNGADTPTKIILRSQLLDWACSLGSPNCNSVAESYAVQLASGVGVPADLQPVIFCKSVSISDSLNLPNQFAVKQYLLEQYQGATRAERFTIFVNALACDSTDYVEMWLNLTTSGASPFSSEHTTTFINRLAASPQNRDVIITYFTDNLERIINTLGETIIGNVVSTMAGYTSGETESARINIFIMRALEVVTNGAVRNSLNNSINTLSTNRAWVADFGAKIGIWLQ
ncbi:endoplasmic reticulum aminopeptidase 2 isoform X2 [Folsomia candida]|uniref:endoplasmic reticulum aminopeptidase 2 isoform X2 n=1 Tax=Folsomia candida TaxID=158441 RepID=UPI000B8F949F|nr:endoplasmic reticulum aminopeptidase 2 isoform X2 [Folsomia candida]